MGDDLPCPACGRAGILALRVPTLAAMPTRCLECGACFGVRARRSLLAATCGVLASGLGLLLSAALHASGVAHPPPWIGEDLLLVLGVGALAASAASIVLLSRGPRVVVAAPRGPRGERAEADPAAPDRERS